MSNNKILNINTNDRETYVEAQEILGIYGNRKQLEIERIKIESRNNEFHIFITKEQLIFISYTNKNYFTTKQNFELFDEIYYYLLNTLEGRKYDEKSFLIEDEKDEIKDIINKYIDEVASVKTIDSLIFSSGQTENLDLKEELDVNNMKIEINDEQNIGNNNKNNILKNNNNDLVPKKQLKNFSNMSQSELLEKNIHDKEKKNEIPGEKIINNKIINKTTMKPHISNSNLLKNESKNMRSKIVSKTIIPIHSKLKNKILEEEIYNNDKEKNKAILKKIYSYNNNNKNYRYNKYNYDKLNIKKNKPDGCPKAAMIVILILVIIIQIVIIPIIICFYNFYV